ncbi:MAG: putative Ca-activated chloride channel family protein [Streblomastix strix]|uniref:Putative Ca-activated chloride channel family protein n=1 Tax=Streblomastix strix TaxID=222440 RepID=A0A5J4X444_9EUKA|nr:MAG: putative Ca-activated chloride channel family protein [Streblomastix strix]
MDYLNITTDYGIYSVPNTIEVVINILLTINAPKAPEQKVRNPVAVALVIDKSGSMEDARKLEYAKIAGKSLIEKLESRDKLSIIAFDANVSILVPIAFVNNKKHLESMINLIQPGSTTYISGGLEAGLNQIEGTKLDGIKRVILLSDGQANVGVQNPEGIAAIAAAHRPNGLSVSTIGLGLNYNENIMQLLAQRGGGQYYYCGEAEDLPNVFDTELLLAKNTVTRRTSALIEPADCVSEVKILGLPTRKQGNETRVDVSDLTSEEERQILIQLNVKPNAQSQQKSDKTYEHETIAEPTRLELGQIRLQFSRTEGGAAEEIEIPLFILVDGDEDRREAHNGDEKPTFSVTGEISSGGRSHVQSIEKVAEFVMAAEASAARTQAIQEVERGNVNVAKVIINNTRQRQFAIQQATIYPPMMSDQRKQLQAEENKILTQSSTSQTNVSAASLANFMSLRQIEPKQQQNGRISPTSTKRYLSHRRCWMKLKLRSNKLWGTKNSPHIC